MSPTEFAIVLVLIAGFRWFLNSYKTIFSMSRHRSHKPPPGPLGLPLIGHLHMLGKLPHHTFYKLSQKYGPIMSLRLGSVPTIIVSSPAAAELFLKTHDTVFASRPKSQAADYLWYNTKAILFTKYGAYWRNVRKFCSLELLNKAKIESMAGMRKQELGFLVESLKRAATRCEVVDLSDKVAHLIEDMTCRMLFGKCRDERITKIIHEMAEIVGAINIADYVPLLGALDLQGFTRRIKVTSKAVDDILETIIDDHEQGASTNGNKNLNMDFVDVVLSLKHINPTSTHEELALTINRSNIKAIILDMMFGAIDTSQTTIKWTMTELIRHPRVMKLLKEEIRNIIGDHEYVEESELPKLDYLDVVVKESMRLHPAVPLLTPHEAMEDIVVDGYCIEKKSRIIINYWGIGRDPKIWSENVEEFFPERFIGSDIDLYGQNFQLIPFGSGRRICPGMHLGLINVKLVVAQLVHSFDWELPFGMSPDELDMDEMFGTRAKHLLAVPSCLQ